MRSTTTGWLLLFPTILILFVVGRVPFLYVLVIGFFDWNVFAADPSLHFAGVENYRRLVFDPAFLRSIGLTLQFAFFVVVSELVLGYLLAQLLMRDFPGKGFFRTMHTLPLMVAPIAVGATWRLLTVPGLGPIPYYLDHWFGIDLPHRHVRPSGIPHDGGDGYLALDAARDAHDARGPRRAAQGAVRAGAGRRRQPLPDLLVHHTADAAAGDPHHRVHPADGRHAHGRRGVDADRRRAGRRHPLHRAATSGAWSSPRPTTATAPPCRCSPFTSPSCCAGCCMWRSCSGAREPTAG